MSTSTSPIVQKLVRAWNSGDVAAIAALYAPDTRMHHPFTPAPLAGREAVRAFEGGMFAAFDQIEWSATHVIEKGDELALEFRVTARHCAPMPTPKGTIPATHKRVDLRGVSLFRLDARGEIAEERRYLDSGALMAQLGLAG